MTDFYANYITRTTFDPDTHSVKNKVDEAVTKNTTKNQHTKTPKMEVEPTEIPEQKMRKCPVTGKMIPVDEKLHGDQHKLDHNKDMKISASDMKMVRKKGAVKDHPMGEDDEDLKEYGLLRASKKSPVSKEGMSMTALRARRAANPMKQVKTGEIIRSKTGTSTLNRRSVNANRAKMGEDHIEEMTFKVQVDGLPVMYIEGDSSGAIKSKLRKKFKDPKAVISIDRITSADKKKELRAKMTEEQVDELSKKTLGSYVKKAAADVDDKAYTQGQHDASGTDSNYNRTLNKRRAGINKAVDKMTSEGAMKRMATQDAEKERLGSKKAAGTGMDTFKKKPEKMDEISKNTIGAYVAGAEKDKIKKYAQSDMGKISKADAYKNQQKRNKGIELAKSKMKPAKVPASEAIVTSTGQRRATSPFRKRPTVSPQPMGEKFANAAQQAAVMADLKASGKYKKKSESVNEVKQDKDVKSMPGTQPAKYYKGVSKSVKDDRAAHFAKKSKMSDNDPAAYKKAPGDEGAKTKPSKATLQVRKMMGEKAQDKSIAGKAKASGMPASVLKKVFNRGMAAYKTGHRPGTSQHQWAHARVNAFIKKGKGTWGGADKDLAAQVKGSKKESVGESLWANIHAKRARIKAGSGEKMRKVGSKGAPTPDQMKKAQGK